MKNSPGLGRDVSNIKWFTTSAGFAVASALGFGILGWNFASAATIPADGTYKVQCGDSVADGGQLNAIGVVEVTSGHATGVLRLELNVSGDGVEGPEAEKHVLPNLKVDGTAETSDSAFAALDARPQRTSLSLTPTNRSMKARLDTFTLVDNNAPDDGDDETSSLTLDRQIYSGICKIEMK
jgi:hypothetical protein